MGSEVCKNDVKLQITYHFINKQQGTYMKALVLKSRKSLKVMDVPMPTLSTGQVLVKVRQCGICGSDIRYFHGENPWAKQTLQMDIPNPPNIILGHEFVGEVVDAHDLKDKELIGKRVAVQTWSACGRCDSCRSGNENFCKETKHLGHGQGWGEMDFYPGGMAEFCPVFSQHVYELPENVTDEQATFLDPLTVALHAVDVAKPEVLNRVVVLGAGPIGIMIAQLSKVYGASEVFITDIADDNLSVASKLGIDHVLNVADSEQTITDLVKKQTKGSGVDRVFNTVGSQDSIVESLALLKNTGIVVLMATKKEEISFPALLLSGERTIKTSTNAMYRDFPRAIELLASGLVKVDPMITHRFNLSDGVKAFETAINKAKNQAIKIVLDCEL
ncbi:MAG: alcohol dehydrogenase catalytic domain-containing protein [Bacteroidales bacterium]|nr:alcohol dehydrogenase catalytic domain-containing protein [Bacteroidales bacterium]